jgi:hypothetical protein
MKQTGWTVVVLLLGLLLLGLLSVYTSAPIAAQNDNLLKQAGFEDGYTGRGRPDLNVPGHWGLWIADQPRDYEWQNRADKVYVFPSRPFTREGQLSLNIDGSYIAFTVAVFQEVEVQPGANLRGSAWAYINTCNYSRRADNTIDEYACQSSPESGTITRVGIDPNGGGNPLAPEIVWSEPEEPHGVYMQMSVDAMATNGWVTLFLWVSQERPSDLNRVYWDSADLRYGGNGPPTPLPVPSATRDLPLPQPPLPDGSIIHIVQPNDTIRGLALVYNTSEERIIQLNSLQNPRFLTVGQVLIIRLPGEQ